MKMYMVMKFFNRKNTCKAVEFIYRFAASSRRGIAYKRHYRNIARILKLYQDDRGIIILSNNFTDSIAEDLIFFLQDKGYMKSTVYGYFGKICTMFRRMSKRGYEVDFSFEEIQTDDEYANTVAISSDEIERIYHLKIKNKERDVVRDRFVCNCLIGMRYSDFSQLTTMNIFDSRIIRKTQKTGESVEVPLHRIVREIINKYNGNFPTYDKSLQNYNKIIKNVCKQAKLTDKVLWERTVGHKVIRKTMKRYELIASHTARRSFATNAYLAEIPVARIMLITGHKTEAAFFRYIRISKKENARILSEHPFFK